MHENTTLLWNDVPLNCNIFYLLLNLWSILLPWIVFILEMFILLFITNCSFTSLSPFIYIYTSIFYLIWEGTPNTSLPLPSEYSPPTSTDFNADIWHNYMAFKCSLTATITLSSSINGLSPSDDKDAKLEKQFPFYNDLNKIS